MPPRRKPRRKLRRRAERHAEPERIMTQVSARDGAAPETVRASPDGPFPNSPHPALVYRKVLRPQSGPAAFEALFSEHGWTGSWRNGIYGFDHFHTNAH